MKNCLNLPSSKCACDSSPASSPLGTGCGSGSWAEISAVDMLKAVLNVLNCVCDPLYLYGRCLPSAVGVVECVRRLQLLVARCSFPKFVTKNGTGYCECTEKFLNKPIRSGNRLASLRCPRWSMSGLRRVACGCAVPQQSANADDVVPKVRCENGLATKNTEFWVCKLMS